MEYAFLDCGGGRRLERFAEAVVVRPAPGANLPPALPPENWGAADLEFTRENGWTGAPPLNWRVRIDPAVLSLRPGAGGQLGVFPEHAAVVERLAAGLDGCAPPPGGWRALNLFAHTGLTTLHLAARLELAAVIHVDAAPAALRLARKNAVLSGLNQAPIRWIADDALTFLRREARRGNTHHIIMADPPAFGRRKKGGEWRLEQDLPELLDGMVKLQSPEAGLLCLTCHSKGWAGEHLAAMMKNALPKGRRVEQMELWLQSECGGQSLMLGHAVLAGAPRRD